MALELSQRLRLAIFKAHVQEGRTLTSIAEEADIPLNSLTRFYNGQRGLTLGYLNRLELVTGLMEESDGT